MEATTVRKERHCKECGSNYMTDFETEACIPDVCVFPSLEICLDCGAVSEFRIQTDHLTQLKRHVRRDSGSV